MSIYATLWTLQFPKEGDDYFECEWIKVWAQAIPAHVGSPTPGMGYEAGDPPMPPSSRPLCKPMPKATPSFIVPSSS